MLNKTNINLYKSFIQKLEASCITVQIKIKPWITCEVNILQLIAMQS